MRQKFAALTLMFFMAIASLSVHAKAKAFPIDSVKTESRAARQAEVDALTRRLKEISEMDKSNLSRKERKELRKEVKDINSTLKTETSGGIYISAGAVLLIILLLILL